MPPPPKKPAAKRAVGKSKTRVKRSTVPMAAVVVCLLVGVMVGGWFVVRDRLPSLASGFDSPRAVLDDFVAVGRDLRDTLLSIEDRQGALAAVDEVESIADRSKALARRAAAFGPLTRAEMTTLKRWMEDKEEEYESEAKLSVAEINRKGTLGGPRLRDAVMDATMAMQDVATIMKQAWDPIPEAKSELQEVERRILMARRQAWAAAMISREGHQEAWAAREIESAADELLQSLEDHRALIEDPGLFRVGSPYFSRSIGLSISAAPELSDSSPVTEAIARFNEAYDKVSGAKWEADARRRRQ